MSHENFEVNTGLSLSTHPKPVVFKAY